MGVGEGEHEHAPPEPVVPVVVTTPAETPEVVAPIVDHAEKIGRLDEKLGQQERNLLEQIGQVRSDLFQAIEEGGRGMTERVSSLEEKLETLLAKVAETAPPEAAPPVPTPAAPEVSVPPPVTEKRKVWRNGRWVTRGS